MLPDKADCLTDSRNFWQLQPSPAPAPAAAVAAVAALRLWHNCYVIVELSRIANCEKQPEMRTERELRGKREFSYKKQIAFANQLPFKKALDVLQSKAIKLQMKAEFLQATNKKHTARDEVRDAAEVKKLIY